MLLNIPLIQVVQVSAKGASLPIDMFCCCCWLYVLLVLVVCSNPAEVRTAAGFDHDHQGTRPHDTRVEAGVDFVLLGHYGCRLGAQSGHSRRLPVWWGRDTWGLDHVKAGQDLLGGRHSLGAPTPYPPSQPTCPVITSQTGLISHTILGLAAKIFPTIYSIEVVSGHTYI